MPEQCEQCGFDGGRYDDGALTSAIRDLGPQWRSAVDGAGDERGMRPAPEVWSALEYAAHTRDVLALHAFGVEQAITTDEPVFPAVEPGLVDEAAKSYAGEDPKAVVAALDTEAHRLVAAAPDPSQWTRGLTLGDERRTVRELLEHALHDAVHHLDDVARGLAQLRA